MTPLRGFGGKTGNSGITPGVLHPDGGAPAAVTSRIQIHATAATLTLPPAIVARMASTIDSISGGVLASIWLPAGKSRSTNRWLWPEMSTSRAAMSTLPNTCRCRAIRGYRQERFQRDYFTMNDCRVSPQPSAPMKGDLRRAERRGEWRFSAKYADFNFCFGKGVNTPAAFAPTAARMKEAADKNRP